MAVTGMGTEGDDVFEDLASLRRRIVSELVALNLHLPGRKPTRRQRDGRPLIETDTVRRHRDGHPVEIALTASPVLDDDGSLIAIGVVLRDAGSRRRELRGFAAIATGFRKMAAAADLDSVARAALDLTQELVGADRGAVSVIEGDRLEMIAWRGFEDETLAPFRSVALDADLPICHTAVTGRAR